MSAPAGGAASQIAATSAISAACSRAPRNPGHRPMPRRLSGAAAPVGPGGELVSESFILVSRDACRPKIPFLYTQRTGRVTGHHTPKG